MANGFSNDLMFALNADFTGSPNPAFSNGLATNGQLWIGNTTPNANGSHVSVGTLTAGAGITITNGPGTITIAASSGGPTVQTLTDDVGVTVFPSGNNIQLQGHVVNAGGNFSTSVAGTNLLKINPMSSARWIVDKLGFNGTHTTIASAITSAASGETIMILPGTYTENLTMKAGINLVALLGDELVPNVTIVGKVSCSYSGTANISNIQLQTNSDNLISLTGANATILNLEKCFLNCSNNTGISSAGSNSSAQVQLWDCQGDLGTTGIGLFAVSNGSINFWDCKMKNSGGSTTVSTVSSAATTSISHCTFNFPFTISNTAKIAAEYSTWDTSVQNATALNQNSTLAGGSNLRYSRFASGSATPVTVGAGAILNALSLGLNSTNTTAISGTGTLNIQGSVIQEATIGNITVSTQVGGTSGLVTTVTPTLTGFIGEQIRGFTASGSAVTLTGSNAALNITSIALTPGIWDVSSVLIVQGGSGVTLSACCITSSSATLNGTAGDSQVTSPTAPGSGAPITLVIPAFRIVVTSNTTYFLVASSTWSVSAPSAYGRLSGTRVA